MLYTTQNPFLDSKIQRIVRLVKHFLRRVAYEGKSYSMFPGLFDCSDEVLAMMRFELIDRMYELGAYEMFYGGMPD